MASKDLKTHTTSEYATPIPIVADSGNDTDKTKGLEDDFIKNEMNGQTIETGQIEEYRTMGRWDTLNTLITTAMGLGVLTLPGVLKTLGIIPGLIAIFGLASVTYYTGIELHQFFCQHPHICNIIDMIGVMGGRTWETVASVGMLVQVLLVTASVSVTLSIILNVLSDHSLCTVAFIAIGSIVCWMLCMPRTMKFVSYTGIPCFISVIAAVLIVMISVSISGPSNAPEGWHVKIKVVGNPTFQEILNSCLKIIYSYAGNVTYISYMAEMKDPKKDFKFALTWMTVICTIVYTTIAIVIYCYAGEYTTSPALGSAPRICAKIAYGIILPAVLSTGLSQGHVGIKYIFIQIMRWIKAEDQTTSNTVKAWSVWGGCATVFWIIAFVLANSIPVFDSIVSIASATTYPWFTYGVSAVAWYQMNKGKLFDGWKQKCQFVLNLIIFLFAFFLNGAGLWSSISELLNVFATGNGVRGCFDCGDNSSI